MRIAKRIIAITLLAVSPGALAVLAVDDNFIIQQDTTTFIDPYANDDVDFNSMPFPAPVSNFQVVTGQATVNTLDGVAVSPGTGFVGTIEIDYIVEDATGTDQGRITLDVQASPPSLQAVDDAFHVLENDAAIPFDVMANDRTVNGGVVNTVSATAQGGTVTLLTGFGPALDYQPPANYTGIDSFTYELLDPQTLQVSQARVTVYVGIVPDQVLTGPVAPLSTEEQAVYDSIADICATDPNTNIPCADINRLDPNQTAELIKQVSGQSAKLQSRSLRQLRGQQTQNLQARLSELRNGNNRVSVNGLNASLFGKSVPLARALQSELNKDFEGGAAGDDFATPWGVFINGNFTVGEADEQDGRPEYDQDGYNVTMGLDYRFSETMVGGVAAGFSQTDMDFRNDLGQQESSSYSLSLFGNYYPMDQVYVDGLLMWVDGSLDTDRLISVGPITQQLSSDSDSQQLVFAASAGYEMSWQRLQASLYGRLEYSNLKIDDYIEKGGSFALAVDEQDFSYFDGALGARMGYVFNLSQGVVVPNLELEYVTRDEDDHTITNRFVGTPGGPRFVWNAEEQDTEYLNLSTSISAVFSGGRSGFFRYETMLLQDDYDLSTYSLGFRMEF